MTKNAVLWVLLLVIMTVMAFSSCEKSSAGEENISGSAEEASQSELVSVTGTEAISETIAFCDEDIFTAAGETGEEAAEPEGYEHPVIIPADEVYEFYPMKIIYPEKQETAVKITTEKMQKDIYIPEGLKAAVFSAEYPVISGIDEAVCKKINDEIKAYIDSGFEAFSEGKDNSEYYHKSEIEVIGEYDQPIYEKTVNMSGTYFDGDGCDINGNIFTVYFADNVYWYGAAHGSEYPVPIMFDLRTGERIYFSELIGDSEGLAEFLDAEFWDFLLMYGQTQSRDFSADQYSEALKRRTDKDKYEVYHAEFGMDEDGNFIAASRNVNERMTVCNGCVGFYLAPYEYGSFADGIRRMDIPASEIIPYLNDKGKALFEGYVSAESVPANIVEYKGVKYFDTPVKIPYAFDENDLTYEDIEFILLFKNAREYEFERYGIEKD